VMSTKFFLISNSVLSTRYSVLSSDDFIRPREHIGWNCQTNLFCRLKVYDEFKLRCLLHRQISRFGTFQDLVHVNSGALMEVSVVLTVRHEAALVDKFLLKINSW